MAGTITLGLPSAAPASTSVTVLDPLRDDTWDHFVDQSPAATVFHSSDWLRVLADTYGFEPRCLAVRDGNGQLRAGLPVVSLPRKRLVGLPFSDYCPPLVDDPDSGDLLLRMASATTHLHPGESLEVRGSGDLDLTSFGFERGSAFFRHVIDLRDDLFAIEQRIHSSARRAVHKAEREGLTVRIATSQADMRDFYELVVRTRRKQRLLPQPLRFYDSIRRHLFDGQHGCLLLAQDRGKVIAGDLLLRQRDTLVYKFNASDERYLANRPNNLLLFHAIRLGHQLGCRQLDLGRCDLDGHGLRRFKLLWGSEERVFHHYYAPGKPASSRSRYSRLQAKVLPEAVPRLPAPLLKIAGDYLYRGFA